MKTTPLNFISYKQEGMTQEHIDVWAMLYFVTLGIEYPEHVYCERYVGMFNIDTGRYRGFTRLTQRNIADELCRMGSHEKFENPQDETTLRRVRQIIRDLRVEFKCPILSDRGGYWVTGELEEALEYIERMEKTAKSQAASWFETYRAVAQSFGVSSDYFEKQLELFEDFR